MNSLIGIWLFTALIYQGNLMDPPNPNLKLYYMFQSTTQNEIYYYRDNEIGHCKRSAEYVADETFIKQTVTDVDPDNNSDCALDTDMQLGNKSQVKYEIIDNKLHLHLPLGEDEIVYIFTKQD